MQILKILGINSVSYLLLFISLVFIVVIAPFEPELNKLSIRIYMVSLLSIYFGIYLIKRKKIPNYLLVFVFLYLFTLLSVLYCIEFELYLLTSAKFTASVIFAFLIVMIIDTNPRFINSFYFVYVILLLYSLYFTYTNGIFLVDTSIRERFSSDVFGTNVLGYYLFFAIFSLWNFSITKFKSNLWVYIVLAFSSLIGLYFLSLGASRGGIIFVVLSILLFILSKLTIRKSQIIRLFTVVFISILFYFLILTIFKAMEGMYIHERFNSAMYEQKDDLRYELILKSLKIGYGHFFTGVGAGNVSIFLDGSFSHSSFTELFANHGIIGLLLYLFLFWDFFKEALSLIRNKNLFLNQYGYFFLSFVVLFFFYNFLYVMYLNPFLIGFFFLMRSHLYHLQLSQKVK